MSILGEDIHRYFPTKNNYKTFVTELGLSVKGRVMKGTTAAIIAFCDAWIKRKIIQSNSY